MKFSYTALTKNNKKITGALEADSKEAVQEDLHKMGVAILSVNEISDEEYVKTKNIQESARVGKGIKTFTFMAIDNNKKEIEGTIDAMDDFSAYKRLRLEYQFKVNDLYLAGATDEEKKQAKINLTNFEKNLKNEKRQTQTNKKEEYFESEESEQSEAINKELIAGVDKIIINTKKIIKTGKSLFSNELLHKIQTTLGELERVRSSNNIKHIQDLSDELYNLISHPDVTDGNDQNINKEYQSIIDEVEINNIARKESEAYQNAIGMSGVRGIFQKITKRLQSLNKPSGDKKESVINKITLKINNFFEKFAKKKSPAPEFNTEVQKSKYNFNVILNKIKSFFKRKEKISDEKHDTTTMSDVVVEDEHVRPNDEKMDVAPINQPAKPEKPKESGYLTYILTEIDSFIAWLICFYIIYFFLVNFSLEKNIGLSTDFVFKTFKTPLIVNISIFLLLIHLSLYIRNIYFRKNIVAGLFLLFLNLGIYTIVIINF